MEQNLKKYYVIDYGFLAAVLIFVALKKSSGASPVSQKKFLNPEVEDAALSQSRNIHLIPDGKGNYRSAQIPADRTGGLVGGYLKKGGYMTDIDQLWNYTTKYNRWIPMIQRKTFFGSGFDKYADCFYPIDKLKDNYRAYL